MYGCQAGYGAGGYCDPCGTYPALYSQSMGGPCCNDGGYSGGYPGGYPGGYYPSAAPALSAPGGGPVVPTPAEPSSFNDSTSYLSPHVSAF
ncbi:MAG: hypothetical protein WD648_11445 [Planctomycetaceae bacterium]